MTRFGANIHRSSQAYLILAVVLGAAAGHLKFGSRMNVEAVLADHANLKGMACH
jgi:copper transporter 1